MSNTVNLAGTAHTLPTSNEVDWGKALSDFLAALPTKVGPAVLLFGSKTTPADTASNYLRAGYSSDAAGTTAAPIRVPSAGKISGLYLQSAFAPAGAGQVVTAYKNGVATALTATLAAAATQAADASHSFTVAAGDRISVGVVGGVGISTGAAELMATMLFSADA